MKNASQARTPRPKLVRVLQTSCAVSPRLLQAAATFGLGIRGASRYRTQRVRRVCDSLAMAGSLVHLGGASGCGKSTLLRQCVMLLREQGRSVIVAGEGETPAACSLMDCVPGELELALPMLGAAGLADALLLGRSLRELSEGERARAVLAQALARSACSAAREPVVLVVDELASALDAVTARGLCTGLRRAIARHNLVLLSASAREEVAGWLCPGTAPRRTRGVLVHAATATGGA
jgi:ABC-type glutathione transport system ATPase component